MTLFAVVLIYSDAVHAQHAANPAAATVYVSNNGTGDLLRGANLKLLGLGRSVGTNDTERYFRHRTGSEESYVDGLLC